MPSIWRIDRGVPRGRVVWVPDVARTLDFIHGKDVIHRDVKPANVLFDAHGHVFLSDFGIAKALGSLDTGLTQTGMTPGSPDYTAPESMTESSLSPAYDQYALAVVVYEALCGALPHGPSGDTPFKVLLRKAQHDPVPLRDRAPHVSAAVAIAVDRALRREPKERFPSCAAFSDAFCAALHAPAADPEAATALPTRAPTPMPVARERVTEPRYGLRRAVGAMVVVGLLAGVLAAAGVFSGTRGPPDDRRKVPVHRADVPPAVPLPPPDTTSPTLAVEPAGPEIEVGPSGRVTLRGQAIDEHLKEVLADNEVIAGVGPDGTFDYEVVLAEGATRAVVFQARDEAGNVSAVVVRTLTPTGESSSSPRLTHPGRLGPTTRRSVRRRRRGDVGRLRRSRWA